MKPVIYDDHADAADSLRSFLLPLLPDDVQVDRACSLAQAQALIDNETDVVFQDIELDTPQNGIHFAAQLRRRFPRLRFVFITAYTEYYEAIFAVDPIAFIRKPFRQEGVQLCVEQLRRHLAIQEQKIVVSPTKGHIQMLGLTDVAYIENSDRHLLLRTAGGFCTLPLQLLREYELCLGAAAVLLCAEKRERDPGQRQTLCTDKRTISFISGESAMSDTVMYFAITYIQLFLYGFQWSEICRCKLSLPAFVTLMFLVSAPYGQNPKATKFTDIHFSDDK